MKSLLAALCLCAPVAVLAAAKSGDVASDRDAPMRMIDRFVTDTMRSTRMPGVSLAIVKGRDIAYLKGYGRADASGRPVTPQTPFMIGSITKPITALTVMQLVEKGAIALDAPVQRYLPWFRVADADASARITVRQLLTMTSGLPQVYETQSARDQDAGALERGVRLLHDRPLSSPPGTRFAYSNANYETLGLIVQTVSGMSYEEDVKAHIFAPLEMHNSFVSQDEAARHDLATGHRWWFGLPVPVVFPYNRTELPAGYIFSSAEDMSHLLIAELNGGRYGDHRVLSAETIALTQQEPAPHTYGLGWESIRDHGHRLINHDGGTANFQSSMFFDPDARIGVFVAANVVSAVDAFASPSGASLLDGSTMRGLAHDILNMSANRPLPAPGWGHQRLTFILNLVIVILTVAVVRSLVRLPAWRRRIERRGRISWRSALWRSAIAGVVNGGLLAILVYVSINEPAWQLVVQFQPDLTYWLQTTAVVLLLRGLVQIAWIWERSFTDPAAPAAARQAMLR